MKANRMLSLVFFLIEAIRKRDNEIDVLEDRVEWLSDELDEANDVISRYRHGSPVDWRDEA